MGHTLEVVVVGILSHPAVEEGPGEIVDSILLVLDGLGDDLCVKVIVQAMIQVALDGQRFVEELFVEILLASLAQEHALGIVIVQRPVCATSHLNQVRDRIIIVHVLLAVVTLSVHDDDQVGVHGQRPAK